MCTCKRTECQSPSLMATDELMEAGPFPRSADIISLPPVSLRRMKSMCLESESRRIKPSDARLRTDNLTETLRREDDSQTEINPSEPRPLRCHGDSPLLERVGVNDEGHVTVFRRTKLSSWRQEGWLRLWHTLITQKLIISDEHQLLWPWSIITELLIIND